MSNRSLVPVTPSDWTMIKEVAPVFVAARMFKVTEDQARIVMLKGHELGLGLEAAFEFIHVIDNKPSVSPKGALALIHQSGQLAGLKVEDMTDGNNKPVSCHVWMKRTNGFEYTAIFTIDDAKRASLIKPKGGWEKYPANMLRWRAIGYCADVVFPDVIGGLLRPGELGVEVDQFGEPIGTWEPIVARAVVETPPEPQETPTSVAVKAQYVTIADLLNAGWDAEQIVAASEGKIPATSEDCQRVAEKLQAGNQGAIQK